MSKGIARTSSSKYRVLRVRDVFNCKVHNAISACKAEKITPAIAVYSGMEKQLNESQENLFVGF